MARGSLILIEGLDRTGKTTQTQLVVEYLQKTGKEVVLIKFPERTTPIGKIINSYLVDKSYVLSDEAAHLLFSANRWEVAPVIEDHLKKGTNVVLDRYVYSGVAYTAAKGLDREWCLSPDIGLPGPDLTIFLNSNDTSGRTGFGDERYEVQEFQSKVREQFQYFQNEKNWKNIYVDGKNIEQVHKEITDLIDNVKPNPNIYKITKESLNNV